MILMVSIRRLGTKRIGLMISGADQKCMILDSPRSGRIRMYRPGAPGRRVPSLLLLNNNKIWIECIYRREIERQEK